MILTTHVICRGKEKPIEELSKTCGYKVDVLCPCCGEIRTVHYHTICRAGHDICIHCIHKIKLRRFLNIGDVYGRLTIIGHSEKSGYSICKCECLNITEIENYLLISGHTRSCGCLKKEAFISAKKVKGEEHGMWKGGISSERSRTMSTKAYKDWRKHIFEKHNYTCQKCGQVGYKLNVHHIINYSENENLRTDEDNGMVFCDICHAKFHKQYGRKNNDAWQINNFLNKTEE